MSAEASSSGEGSSAQSRGVQLVLDLFCGSCQFGKAARIHHPRALILCVDLRSRETLEEVFSQYDLKSFFEDEKVRFVQKDLRLIEPRDVLLWCADAGCQPADIIGVGASFPCDTSTLANRINSEPSRDLQDVPKSIEAQWDEELRYSGIATIKWIVREAPTALIILENPWSSTFRKSPLVIGLVRDRKYGFKIIREDLCATVGRHDVVWKKGKGKGKGKQSRVTTPKKPTALVVRGFHVERYVGKGERRCKKQECPMVYKGTKIHKRVVMSKSHKAKEKDAHNFLQIVVPKEYNSMLSIGMFEALWEEHAVWREEYGMDYYCAVCGNNDSEEKSECIACESEGCTRIQHSECSIDKRDSSGDWRCDTCYGRQRLGMSTTTNNRFQKMEKLVDWLDRGLISPHQFQEMSAELK